MIRSFRCRETEKIFRREHSTKIPQNLHRVALRKLTMLQDAEQLDDLKSPPGNRLEALKGDRKDTYSIRINDRYRICFVWQENSAFEVEIVDYHG